VTESAGRPTPVLVTGVERRCRVATDQDASAGRPSGLYGNAFARADAETIMRATTRIDPPTITNLIAMAAPVGGVGPYSRASIERILVTAYTGFRAAFLGPHASSVPSSKPSAVLSPIVIHTGFWGCGAFGGNRSLMAVLQILAAEMAGACRLVFHTGKDEDGPVAFSAAQRIVGGAPGERITDSRS
jgi:hypothetical protein